MKLIAQRRKYLERGKVPKRGIHSTAIRELVLVKNCKFRIE